MNARRPVFFVPILWASALLTEAKTLNPKPQTLEEFFMANHFAYQFSKILPATAPTPNPADALRTEVVPAILARMKLSAAFYFGFSPYRQDREKTFRRLLLEKPNGDRLLVRHDRHRDMAAQFRGLGEMDCVRGRLALGQPSAA